MKKLFAGLGIVLLISALTAPAMGNGRGWGQGSGMMASDNMGSGHCWQEDSVSRPYADPRAQGQREGGSYGPYARPFSFGGEYGTAFPNMRGYGPGAPFGHKEAFGMGSWR